MSLTYITQMLRKTMKGFYKSRKGTVWHAMVILTVNFMRSRPTFGQKERSWYVGGIIIMLKYKKYIENRSINKVVLILKWSFTEDLLFSILYFWQLFGLHWTRRLWDQRVSCDMEYTKMGNICIKGALSCTAIITA